MQEEVKHRPLIAAGTTLGIGLGAFIDGILLHQILQVHNMMSAVRPKTTLVNMEINMFWDGLFHLFAWIVTAVGVAMLWGAVRRGDVPLSTRSLVGSLVMGWGIFNLVEGIIDHHILNIHHVVERLGVSVYDYGFLGFSVLLVLGGWALIRAGMGETDSERPARPFKERGVTG